MLGSSRSRSQIQSLNGSSFDTVGAREYLGGVSNANARRTVLRCSPVRRLISRIDNRSTRCMRLISAHCSTPTTRLLLARADAQARGRTQPDAPNPTPKWVTFRPAQLGQYSGGAHTAMEAAGSWRGP